MRELAHTAAFPSCGISRTRFIAQAETLGEDLESDGLDDVGDREHFVFAGYDSPFRIFRRHNEVWFLAPYPEEVTKN